MNKTKNTDWFPRSRAKQLVMCSNLKAKIGNYETLLSFPTAKTARIILICDIFIELYNYVEQVRATTFTLTGFQNLIFNAQGGTQGAVAPEPPVFQTVTLPAGAFVGIFQELRELVDDIKNTDKYTRAIGEDLMIVAPESEEMNLNEVVPALKINALMNDYKVRVEGSLRGFKAIKIEYTAKGAVVPQEFFLTKLPGSIKIIPQQPGNAESGSIRGVFIKDNEEVGQRTPMYPVTIS